MGCISSIRRRDEHSSQNGAEDQIPRNPTPDKPGEQDKEKEIQSLKDELGQLKLERDCLLRQGKIKCITVYIIYNTCKYHADKEMQRIHSVVQSAIYEPLSPELQKQIADKRKENYKAGVERMRLNVSGELRAFLTKRWQMKMIPDVMTIVDEYVDECLELCWLMVIQDPPLFMDCSIVDKCLKEDYEFERELYRTYRLHGEKIAFIVMPVLYLQESGPVLHKGTAKGKASQKEEMKNQVVQINSPKPQNYV